MHITFRKLKRSYQIILLLNCYLILYCVILLKSHIICILTLSHSTHLYTFSIIFNEKHIICLLTLSHATHLRTFTIILNVNHHHLSPIAQKSLNKFQFLFKNIFTCFVTSVSHTCSYISCYLNGLDYG